MFCILYNNSTRLYILLLLTFLTLLAPQFANGALKNVTVDDTDWSRFTYTPAANWSHDPLIGWESFFYNGSRSYTWMPTGYVSFTFIGTGVYFQGPYAPDQALRNITLDGEYMGTISAYAPDRSPSVVFWGKGGLDYKSHTVVATHADTTNPATIFVIDCIYAEYDDSIASSPFSTPTTTISGSVATASGEGSGPVATTSGEGNTTPAPFGGASEGGSSNGRSKNNTGVIVGVVVPVVFLVTGICLLGIYLYRLRSRSPYPPLPPPDSSREKVFGRGQPPPPPPPPPESTPFDIPRSTLPYTIPPGARHAVHTSTSTGTVDTARPNYGQWTPAESTTDHGGSIQPPQFGLIGVPLNYRPVATAQSTTTIEDGFGEEKRGRSQESNMSRDRQNRLQLNGGGGGGETKWSPSATGSTTSPATTDLQYPSPGPGTASTLDHSSNSPNDKDARNVGAGIGRASSAKRRTTNSRSVTPKRTPSRGGSSIWSPSDSLMGSPALSPLPPPYTAVSNSTAPRTQSRRTIQKALDDRGEE